MASLVALANGLYVLDDTPDQPGGVALNDNFTLLDNHLGQANPHGTDWTDFSSDIGRDLVPDSSYSRNLGSSSYSWYYGYIYQNYSYYVYTEYLASQSGSSISQMVSPDALAMNTSPNSPRKCRSSNRIHNKVAPLAA